MNELLSIIPEKYRSLGLTAIALSPFISRALHALYNGRGIKGAIAGIWLGTNTPATSAPTLPVNPGIKIPLMVLVACLVLGGTGCAHMVSRTEKTKISVWTFWDSNNALAKGAVHQTDKTQGTTLSGLSESSSSTNLNSIVESVVGAAVKAAKP